MPPRAWPSMPGVSAAGHVTSHGHWHPGRIDGCVKCTPRSNAMRVRLTTVTRLHNSFNGNPRFALSWSDGSGRRDSANTATDSSYSYEVGEKGMRAGDWVLITLNGRGTIERIEATR